MRVHLECRGLIMPVGNVSFGSVIALTGKPRDVKRMNNRLNPLVNSGKILSYNITNEYRHQSASNGSISAAVSRGEEAFVYVTGKDVEKVRTKQKGWASLFDVLSNMSQYINLNKTRVSKAFDMIV